MTSLSSPQGAPVLPKIPERIVVVGSSSSGKSTLAARLARAIEGDFVELDALYWLPGWQGRDDEEFARVIREATAGPRWVVAGSYWRVTQHEVWPRAELVVWLDLPLRTLMPRLLRRTWRRWRTHELLWGTNYESAWQHLRLWEPENLFRYTVLNHRRVRRRYLEQMSEPRWSHLRVVRLCSPAEIEAFTQQFEEQARAAAGSAASS